EQRRCGFPKTERRRNNFPPLQTCTTLYAIFTQVLRGGCVSPERHSAKDERAVRFLNEEGALMQSNQPMTWEELYAAAVLETDPERISERIALAQDALRDRWRDLQQLPLVRNRERQRVEDAIRTLNLIRQTELRSSA